MCECNIEKLIEKQITFKNYVDSLSAAVKKNTKVLLLYVKIVNTM